MCYRSAGKLPHSFRVAASRGSRRWLKFSRPRACPPRHQAARRRPHGFHKGVDKLGPWKTTTETSPGGAPSRSVPPAPMASPSSKAAPSAGCGSWQSRERSPGCGASPTALTPTGHGAPDRTLAGAAPAQADLKGAPPGVAGRPASALLGREAVTPHGPKPRTRALGSQGASSRTKDIRAEVRPGGRVVLSGGERRPPCESERA